MFKIIGCIMIVFSSTMAGFSKSQKLYNRRDFLNSFLMFLNFMSTSIRYNASDIEILISMCSGDFAEVISNAVSENNFSLPKKWINGINSIPKSYSLTYRDKQMMFDFGEKLGTTDVEGQIKHIEMYVQLAENQKQNAEKEIADKSKIYKALGFFAGISIALIII